jgi:hypothetical protein
MSRAFYLLLVCLLPTVALAGQRSEPRSLYQRPDRESRITSGASMSELGGRPEEIRALQNFAV